MTALARGLSQPLVRGGALLAIGVLVALTTIVALNFVAPAKAIFAFGGLIIILPAFLVRDPRAYGLFVLVFCIPIEIYQHTTKWLSDPGILFEKYGFPGTGTSGVDMYIADFVLVILLVPWLAEICRRERRLYFPKIGYIFILYLAWALLVSMLQAVSFYLSIFEWVREILYFILFLYIVNNVVTPAQFRAVILALFAGLAIESMVVIGVFDLNVGAEVGDLQGILTGGGTKLTTAGTVPVSETGSWFRVKRSRGTFAHPGVTAYYIGYILPIVLASWAASRRRWDRIALGTIFLAGAIALLLTFSRSGLMGVTFSMIVLFPLARWARLISRQMFSWCILAAVMAVAVSTPLLVDFFATRPIAVTGRLELIAIAEETYLRHPILGAGLNNSSAVTEGSHETVSTQGGPAFRVLVVHNHYLIVLIEVGAIGFLLFFGFFGGTVMTALRSMRAAGTEMKLLLVGLVSAVLGIAVHNFGDPFGGHMCMAMLWLNAGLVFAICRRVQAEAVLPARITAEPAGRALPAAAGWSQARIIAPRPSTL